MADVKLDVVVTKTVLYRNDSITFAAASTTPAWFTMTAARYWITGVGVDAQTLSGTVHTPETFGTR